MALTVFPLRASSSATRKTASASIGLRTTASLAAESARAGFPAATWAMASVWKARAFEGCALVALMAVSTAFDASRLASCSRAWMTSALTSSGFVSSTRLMTVCASSSCPCAKAISPRRSQAGNASGAFVVMSVRTFFASSTRRVST